jgi:hypothetical protein
MASQMKGIQLLKREFLETLDKRCLDIVFDAVAPYFRRRFDDIIVHFFKNFKN